MERGSKSENDWGSESVTEQGEGVGFGWGRERFRE